MTEPYYRANEPAISHEAMGGEIVIIHFDTGTYYSLAGSGALVWGWLVGGLGREAILTYLSASTPALVEPVMAFIDELVKEHLLLPTPTPAAAPTWPPTMPAPLDPPVLQKFTDMQELLLLDPIHDVTEAGWPHQPTGADA